MDIDSLYALLLPATVAIPLLGAVLIAVVGDSPNQRETITLVTAGTLFITVLALAFPFQLGSVPHVTLAVPIPALPILLRIEPLGLTFACVASGLWILNSLYSIGYMRGNKEPHQTRFYICFALALGSTMGVAFAGNMFTLFIFYEMLSLSTYPLVTHHQDAESRRAGRTYLGLLMGTSIGLMLLAMMLTWATAGTTEFKPGGILNGRVPESIGAILLLLYMYGIGKAAIMPVHRWLPAAMVAPTPVSALLHAVAVVKTGVFTVLKVSVYIFGVDYLNRLWSTDVILYIAAFSLLAASIVAMRQDNLKRRLAYSTVSQLAYVVVGAMLASSAGVMGAGLQIVMHAFGKITLFFCAGAIYTAAHKTLISQMDGLGRTMPWTMTAFAVGALSVIGLPPLGGSWAKFFLFLGAVEADKLVLVAVLSVSTLLNVFYLLGPVLRAFFRPLPADAPTGRHEAPVASVVPLCLTAFGCLLLFFFAGSLYDALLPITEGK
ncbi:MAG: monovalent cation/H+ antiporter subunit D family protein [Alphaproteobacteria bacterium]